jgi:hypothetical protein
MRDDVESNSGMKLSQICRRAGGKKEVDKEKERQSVPASGYPIRAWANYF